MEGNNLIEDGIKSREILTLGYKLFFGRFGKSGISIQHMNLDKEDKTLIHRITSKELAKEGNEIEFDIQIVPDYVYSSFLMYLGENIRTWLEGGLGLGWGGGENKERGKESLEEVTMNDLVTILKRLGEKVEEQENGLILALKWGKIIKKNQIKLFNFI